MSFSNTWKASMKRRTSKSAGSVFALAILCTAELLGSLMWANSTCANSPKSLVKSAPSDSISLEGMTLIPSGEFLMGSTNQAFPDSGPVHKVRVSQFWLDNTVVTNRQFSKFVTLTGYKTVSERYLSYQQYPNMPDELRIPGAFVFASPSSKINRRDYRAWWNFTPGANWRHPEGPKSNLIGREDYPVVQIAWEDAQAFARWANKRLPTEAEFEYAARGGLAGKSFSWGDELKPGNNWQANVWQGAFPYQNSAEDGFIGLAPVRSFPKNGYGLYDMTGNVWQWCSDWYMKDYKMSCTRGISVNPQGPETVVANSVPAPQKVLRGGSYLCSDTYCSRYFVAARGKADPYTSSCNVGFRCARDFVAQSTYP